MYRTALEYLKNNNYWNEFSMSSNKSFENKKINNNYYIQPKSFPILLQCWN